MADFEETRREDEQEERAGGTGNQQQAGELVFSRTRQIERRQLHLPTTGNISR